MRAERVSECEIESAVRGKGILSMSRVESIIMEPDASLSVIQKPDNAAVGELWTKLGGCESNDERRKNPTKSADNR